MPATSSGYVTALLIWAILRVLWRIMQSKLGEAPERNCQWRKIMKSSQQGYWAWHVMTMYELLSLLEEIKQRGQRAQGSQSCRISRTAAMSIHSHKSCACIHFLHSTILRKEMMGGGEAGMWEEKRLGILHECLRLSFLQTLRCSLDLSLYLFCLSFLLPLQPLCALFREKKALVCAGPSHL